MIFIKLRELLFGFTAGGRRAWMRLVVLLSFLGMFGLMVWAGATVLLPDAVKRVRGFFEAESVAKGRGARVGRRPMVVPANGESDNVVTIDSLADDESFPEGNGTFQDEVDSEEDVIGLASTPEKALALPTPKTIKKPVLKYSANELYLDMFATGKASESSSEKFADFLEDGAAREGVDSIVIASIIAARSKMEANFTLGERIGYFAINPAEAAAMAHFARVKYESEAQLNDPLFNLDLGIRYIGWLYRTLKKNERYVLVAFEMGFDDFLAMVKAKEPVPEEVQLRVEEVLRFKGLLQKRIKGAKDEEVNVIEVEEDFGEVSPAKKDKNDPPEAKSSATISSEKKDRSSTSASPMPTSKLSSTVVAPTAASTEAPRPTTSPTAASTPNTTPSVVPSASLVTEKTPNTLNGSDPTNVGTALLGSQVKPKKLTITRDLTKMQLILPEDRVVPEQESARRPGKQSAQAVEEGVTSNIAKRPEACPSEAERLSLMLKDSSLNSPAFRSALDSFAKRTRLSQLLVVGIANELSKLKADLISDDPIRVGLFQFVATDGSKIARDAEVAWAGSKELQNPEYVMKLASGYMERLLDLAGGNQDLAVCAFMQPYGQAKQMVSSKTLRKSCAEVIARIRAYADCGQTKK